MVVTARIALATQFIPSYSLVSANCEPIYYIVPWVYASHHPKQYLDRFSHLRRAVPNRYKHTDRHTDHVFSNSSHLAMIALLTMRANNNNNNNNNNNTN